ncbi:MAG: RsmG family class I SAM-dependent methyltransferase [Pseudomonadota bacterium]|nr:RsmG family class I SAM-dependent methyltransferase [Pseudomonadota bacterium]
MINEWFEWLDSEKLGKINQFREILIKFNDSINLISPNTVKVIDNVHLADCILASKYILENLNSDTLFDLGSGNGMPGIVLAVLSLDRKIVLIDRDQKKLEFLKHVISELKLTNVSCATVNLGQDKSLAIGQSVTRAMAPLGRFLSSMKDQFISGGKCYLMKTPKWESELAPDHGYLLRTWSWRVVNEYVLPLDSQKRVIIELIRK